MTKDSLKVKFNFFMLNFFILTARVSIAFYFFFLGIGRLKNFQGSIEFLSSRLIPYPEFSIFIIICLLLIGSFLIILGLEVKTGCTMIGLYILIEVLFINMPIYCNPSENLSNCDEFITFLKNLSILGSVVLLYINGPGNIVFSIKKR